MDPDNPVTAVVRNEAAPVTRETLTHSTDFRTLSCRKQRTLRFEIPND
jgi:hypothetical protein